MGFMGVSLKPLKRAFGMSAESNNRRPGPRAEDDESLGECGGSNGSPTKGGLLSPSTQRIQTISNDVVQVVDGKSASYVFVPNVFDAPGCCDGQYLLELIMALEGGRIVPIIKAKCESRRYSDGDAFVVKKAKSKVPLAKGKMTLRISKINPDKSRDEPLESFSFNFKLNAGIHGLSNIGVKGETDSFAVLDLKSSVHSQEAQENQTPDVHVDAISFFVADTALDARHAKAEAEEGPCVA